MSSTELAHILVDQGWDQETSVMMSGDRRVLRALELDTPLHAPLCLPKTYWDCTQEIQRVRDSQVGLRVVLRVTPTDQLFSVDDAGAASRFSGFARILRAICILPSGDTIALQMFGVNARRSEWNWLLRETDPVVVTGVVGRAKGYRGLVLYDPIRVPPRWQGRVWPQYRGIPGTLSGERVEAAILQVQGSNDLWRKSIDACVQAVLRDCNMTESEAMDYIAVDRGASSAVSVACPARLSSLFHALHRPQSMEQALRAQQAARRLSIRSVIEGFNREHARDPCPTAPLMLDQDLIAGWIRRLSASGVRLTPDQRRAIRIFFDAFKSETPVRGLLNADVGTGKTIPFLLLAFAAQRAQAQSVIICPTQLLAAQLAQVAQRLSETLDAGVQVALVTSGRRVKNPDAVLIGTEGITSVCRKQGIHPRLLICDEQHKLSVASREALVGPDTHCIDVTATPIPRTLAAVAYSNVLMVNMRQSPVDKQITSVILFGGEERRALDELKACLSVEGQRAAVVYSVVASLNYREMQRRKQILSEGEDPGPEPTLSPEEEKRTVMRAHENLSRLFPGQVGYLHGKMPQQDKDAAMQAWRSGAVRLMVATTVLETGIDVPDIRLVIVRSADRMGAAQLHQIRGRLARNGGPGKFIMMVAAKNAGEIQDTTLNRLQAVASCHDGASLAEADLLARNIGGGAAQSGRFKTVFKLTGLTVSDVTGIVADRATEGKETEDRATDLRESTPAAGQPVPIDLQTSLLSNH